MRLFHFSLFTFHFLLFTSYFFFSPLIWKGTNAYAQFLGGTGGLDGRVVGSVYYGACSVPYINITQGGSADGHISAPVNYVDCNTDFPFAGGHGTTMAGGAGNLNQTACTITYTNVAAGGNQDGHAAMGANYLDCNTNFSFQGGHAGSMTNGGGTLNQTSCTVAYTTVTQGGNADGNSTGDLLVLDCGNNFTFKGGSAGGQAYGTLNQTSCAVAYSNVTQGGSYDGHSKDAPVACMDVVCPVVPDAGSDAVICNGQSTNLNASGGVSYSWSPSTGLSNSNIANPVASPASTTTYTVSVSNGSCSQPDAVVVTVNPVPTVTVSGTTPICQGSNTTLTATGGGTYSWNTGETTASITVSPATTTTYTVTVTNGFGCSTVANKIITVNPLPAANTGGNQTLCETASTTLGAAPVGGNSYLWSPSTALSSTTVSNPTANPTSTITYTLTETIDATGCQKSNNAVITVIPKAAIAGTPAICAGGSTTLTASGGSSPSYSWNTGETTNSITVSPAVTTVYTVTLTDAYCTSSANKTVTVNPLPDAVAGSDRTICGGTSTVLGAAPVGGNTYSWTPATALSSSTVANPTANPSSTITYTLTETVTATGCQKSNSVTVTVVPAAAISGTFAVCAGGSTALTASGGGASPTYLWNPGGATTVSVTVTPAVTTVYSVTITDALCTSTANQTVTVNPLPAANTGGDKTICSGQSIGIGSAPVGGDTYSWTPSAGLSSTTIANPTANPASTITYTLTEIVTATGCIKSSMATISVLTPASILGTSSLCLGDVTMLTATGVGDFPTYLWNTSATTQTITVNPASTTTYTVTISNGSCSSNASLTITVVSPCNTYSNVAAGGNNDGHGLAFINYLDCNPEIVFTGGDGGGYIGSLGSFTVCSATYTNVVAGGNADGHASGENLYLACNTSTPYLGGITSGYIVSTLNLTNCAPAYTNVTQGGNNDGHSFGENNNYLVCNTSSPYMGGIASGTVRDITNYTNCAPAYSNVAAGGDKDGNHLVFPVSCMEVLPVELLRFTAVLFENPQSEKQVLCEWETTSESNNDYFTVEKTTDMKNITVAGTVKGAGNSSVSQYYSLIDEKPFTGISYYRLIQTDYDGSKKYSLWVPIQINNEKGIEASIFPNPVADELTIFVSENDSISTTVTITDIVGKKVFERKISFGKEKNKFFINTSSFQQGVYFLKMEDAVTQQTIRIERFAKID